MQIEYTTPNGKLTFSEQVAGTKEAFALVAEIQEVFQEPHCGLCLSEHVRCNVRVVDNFTYYELVCAACQARLNVGQNKDAKGLFIRRRDKDGALLPAGGWYIYQPNPAGHADHGTREQGAPAHGPKPQPPPQPPPGKGASDLITDDQQRTLMTELKRTATDIQRFLTHYKAKLLRELTQQQFADAVLALGKKPTATDTPTTAVGRR